MWYVIKRNTRLAMNEFILVIYKSDLMEYKAGGGQG